MEIELRALSGARAMRVIHGPHQVIAEHDHDWPSLTLPVLGECTESCEAGVIRLAGLSAVIHPPGAFHSDTVSGRGMETVSIQLDPAWLSDTLTSSRLGRTRFVSGGRGGAAATRLSRLWATVSTPESELRQATGHLIALALSDQQSPPGPHWISAVAAQAGAWEQRTADLARRLRIHPAWLARAYRNVIGEGLHETARRNRIERAVLLLRTTQRPLADVALESGFCDQSHMTRNLRQLLGRTPRQIRAEGVILKKLAEAPPASA